MRAAVAHDKLEAVRGQTARRRQRREASVTLADLGADLDGPSMTSTDPSSNLKYMRCGALVLHAAEGAGGLQSRGIEDCYAASAVFLVSRARAVGDEDLAVGDGEAPRPRELVRVRVRV